MVPSGLSAIRDDVHTYFRVQGATTVWDRLRILLTARALWALAFYRWGRWIYAETRGSRVLRKLSRICHALLRDWVQRLTRVALPVQTQVGRDLWIGSHDTTRISPFAILGDGVRLFGGNTLGLGGRGANRGAPKLGDGVVLSPGAVAVGPIVIAEGVTLGPNACAVKSIAAKGLFVGAPAKESSAPPAQFIPLFEVHA